MAEQPISLTDFAEGLRDHLDDAPPAFAGPLTHQEFSKPWFRTDALGPSQPSIWLLALCEVLIAENQRQRAEFEERTKNLEAALADAKKELRAELKTVYDIAISEDE